MSGCQDPEPVSLLVQLQDTCDNGGGDFGGRGVMCVCVCARQEERNICANEMHHKNKTGRKHHDDDSCSGGGVLWCLSSAYLVVFGPEKQIFHG